MSIDCTPRTTGGLLCVRSNAQQVWDVIQLNMYTTAWRVVMLASKILNTAKNMSNCAISLYHRVDVNKCKICRHMLFMYVKLNLSLLRADEAGCCVLAALVLVHSIIAQHH